MGLEVSVEAERESEDFFLRPEHGDDLSSSGAQPCQGLGTTSTCEPQSSEYVCVRHPSACD